MQKSIRDIRHTVAYASVNGSFDACSSKEREGNKRAYNKHNLRMEMQMTLPRPETLRGTGVTPLDCSTSLW